MHWLDSFMNVYLLAIGDYQGVNFGDHFDTGTQDGDRLVYYIIFIVATILLQITLLNMLIALMAESFSHVYDNKQRYSLRQQTQLVQRYLAILNVDADLISKRFMYVIEPRDATQDENSEEGTI